MVVRKILETTIASGGTTATFTDADIPNSLIRVYATNSNIYPQNISLSGNTLTVTYEVVSSAMGVAVEIVKQGLEIVDALNSNDSDKALSAKQGKSLKDSLDTLDATVQALVIPDEITDLSDVEVTSIQDGQVLAWSDDEQKFINVDQSGGGGSYSETVIYQNTSYDSAAGTDTVNKSYTLADSLNNYDAVLVYGWMYNVKTSADNNRANLVSMLVGKTDFYDTAISQGSPATNPFLLNGSTHTARRAMVFQFTDATHITTASIRTEAYVEPILEKVVGIKY